VDVRHAFVLGDDRDRAPTGSFGTANPVDGGAVSALVVFGILEF